MAATAFGFSGEPVIIPGSMGSSSFLLAGLGCPESMASASHGAGRSLSRGDALRASDDELHEFLKHFRIVTPVDPRRADLRGRRDIIQKWEEELKKEAPWAYKDISSVIETQTAAGVGRVIAELCPLLTVKGWFVSANLNRFPYSLQAEIEKLYEDFVREQFQLKAKQERWIAVPVGSCQVSVFDIVREFSSADLTPSSRSPSLPDDFGYSSPPG